MNEIMLATKNNGKIREFSEILGQLHIKTTSIADLSINIDEIEETGITFRENAQIKVETIARFVDVPVLADDSGLVIDALDGEPGIYSARYAGESATDAQNNNKVLQQLKGLPIKKRTARFVAVIALVHQDGTIVYKEGTCKGHISDEPLGTNGFGYDPIFVPEGYNKTMAQLAADEKNTISHRAKALEKLVSWLQTVVK